MALGLALFAAALVAPARERGLKYAHVLPLVAVLSRSREGAWIEIWGKAINDMKPTGRSREGAWIEIIRSLTNGIGKLMSLPRGSVD